MQHVGGAIASGIYSGFFAISHFAQREWDYYREVGALCCDALYMNNLLSGLGLSGGFSTGEVGHNTLNMQCTFDFIAFNVGADYMCDYYWKPQNYELDIIYVGASVRNGWAYPGYTAYAFDITWISHTGYFGAIYVCDWYFYRYMLKRITYPLFSGDSMELDSGGYNTLSWEMMGNGVLNTIGA